MITTRNPHWTESPLDGIPTGRNPHWTESPPEFHISVGTVNVLYFAGTNFRGFVKMDLFRGINFRGFNFGTWTPYPILLNYYCCRLELLL